jgi:TPR repeat protein
MAFFSSRTTAKVDVEAELARARAAAESGEYARALEIWGPLAHSGVARAQNNIGACFAEGLGVDRDGALARKWLELSAAAGDPVGQRNLASLLFKGELVESDIPAAADLYRKAAEAGDGPSQDMLSWLLLEGESVPSDPAGALKWATAAAA